ncbi:MAG: hypothetical protein GY765_00890 [bacterium]|nr:hypothetical protein [bacterium]
MKKFEQFLKKGSLAALCLMLFVSAVFAGHNCDFAAVLALDGHSIAGSDNAENLFYEFVRSRSSLSPWGYNPHGYGVLYANHGQALIPRDTQFYYSVDPYYSDVEQDTLLSPWQMNDARDDIMSPANNAVMVMSHARWGTGGEGNHPFTFKYNGKTFAFMHNGSLYDDPIYDPVNIKEALWNELYTWGAGGGAWFRSNNPNWIDEEDYDDYTKFIDSELLFHFIMMNIRDHYGSVFAGIRTALTATIHESDDTEIDLTDYFMVADGANKINFVLYDGSFYVYRNKPWSGNTYNLSYEVYDDGVVGIKTQGSLENRIPQFSLVRIERDGDIFDYSTFHLRNFADLKVEMKEDPDPVSVGERLTYYIRITNTGPYAAHDIVVRDDLPRQIINPYYHFTHSRRVAPWSGSVIIDRMEPGEVQYLEIYGDISSDNLSRSIGNEIRVYESRSHILHHDPDFSNNTYEVRTDVNPSSIDIGVGVLNK